MARATRSSGAEWSVALVTCADVPNPDQDTVRVIEPLKACGIAASRAVWDDPTLDWACFDLCVVRSCRDYHCRHAEFLRWLERVPRLANPASVLAWNMHKRYLSDLAAEGVPTVPTTWLHPTERWTAPRNAEWVIKPAMSLAALDTGRYRMDDAAQRGLAVAHIGRLQKTGRTVMIQRHLPSVDRDGETSLVFIDGQFSHAIRRHAVLAGPDMGADRRFDPPGALQVERCTPDFGQVLTARHALAAVPGGPFRLLYARVDLVADTRGRPVVIELELIEPQLYLAFAPSGAERLAKAIAVRARRPRACTSNVVNPSGLQPSDPTPW
jgi:hypothetical protein